MILCTIFYGVCSDIVLGHRRLLLDQLNVRPVLRYNKIAGNRKVVYFKNKEYYGPAAASSVLRMRWVLTVRLSRYGRALVV